MKTISVEELKKRTSVSDTFDCNAMCETCIFYNNDLGCLGVSYAYYDFVAINSHDFSPKTEITIDDLKPFKI